MDVAGVLKREFVFWGPLSPAFPKILNPENWEPSVPLPKILNQENWHPLDPLSPPSGFP